MGVRRWTGALSPPIMRRVALFEAPDSAGGAAVDELEAGRRELRVAALGVLVVGVAAVDDGVASGEQTFEACDGVVDGIAGGDHDPDGAGGGEILDEVFEGVDAEGACGGEFGGGVLVEVEADDLVAGEAEALRHVEAHLSETDDSEFHVVLLLTCLCCGDMNSELSEVAGELLRRFESGWRSCRRRLRRGSFRACRR